MDLKTVTALDPRKKALSLLQEFKSFALKGNVIDLAVAVIIGAAFGKIISSLVENIFMPLIGLILPGRGYQEWVLEIGETKIAYGRFLGDVVYFLIVALFVFVVKFLKWVIQTKKEEAAATPPLTKDQELLTEICDLLRRDGQPVKAGDLPPVKEPTEQ